MKIAIVTIGGYQSFGGPAKSVKAFQQALDARVVVWADQDRLQGEPLVFDKASVVRPIAAPFFRRLLYPRRADLLRAGEAIADCDFISCHLFWRWHVRWVESFTRQQDRRFWFVPHGGLDPYVFQTGAITKTIFMNVIGSTFLSRCAGVVYSTRGEYEKSRFRIPKAQPYILPWPLDQADIRYRDNTARDVTRKQLGIPDDAICLLYVGRLHPMKRPLETISALAASKALNVHLILVGGSDGVSSQTCNQHAIAQRVEKRVHIVGAAFNERKHAYYDAADVFISLSHRENFNLAAAEAMGSGLPVILSPGNDLAGDLSGVDCGWMLTQTSAAADTIQHISTIGTPMIERMGARGRDWAARNLDFARFQQRLRNYADQASARRR